MYKPHPRASCRSLQYCVESRGNLIRKSKTKAPERKKRPICSSIQSITLEPLEGQRLATKSAIALSIYLYPLSRLFLFLSFFPPPSFLVFLLDLSIYSHIYFLVSVFCMDTPGAHCSTAILAAVLLILHIGIPPPPHRYLITLHPISTYRTALHRTPAGG